MPEPTLTEVVLEELRELRAEFREFKDEALKEAGERKGRQSILAAGISIAVSVLVHVFFGK